MPVSPMPRLRKCQKEVRPQIGAHAQSKLPSCFSKRGVHMAWIVDLRFSIKVLGGVKPGFAK